MANISSVMKDEIVRHARKEIRAEMAGLKKASAHYRSDIALLKRNVIELQKRISVIEKNAPKQVAPKVEPAVEVSGARFTAKGFKTLRHRLGLTAEAIGLLLDVSAQSIYNWEGGASSPRSKQMERIVMLRGMGKREVQSILNQASGKQ